MRRILIVDDEPNVLSALRRSLSARQASGAPTYHVETFHDPGLALARARETPFEIFLADYRMPDMNGVQFLSEAQALQPDAIRIILSGYADLDALVGAINEAQIFRFISKPWVDYELRAVLEHALQYRDLQVENRNLANIIRAERNKALRQEAELRRLEQESPGITRVKWGSDGEVIFDELTSEEMLDVERLLQGAGTGKTA